MRVAPRSVTSRASVSATIVADVAGGRFDRAGAGDVADGAEAHRRVSTVSPARGGVSGVTGTSRPLRAHDLRAGARSRSTAAAMLLALDVLPDVELGPVGDREHAHVLARVHARVVQGPQLGPLVLRVPLAEARRGSEKMRSLARAFSSSRRAPPISASKRNSSIASSSVTDWCGVARFASRCAGARVPRCDRILDRCARSAARRARAARRSRNVDHLGEVVAGVDVQQREREARRAGTPSRRGAAARANPCRRRTAAPAFGTAPATSRRMKIASASSQSRCVRAEQQCGRARARSCGGSISLPVGRRAGRIPWLRLPPTTSGRRARLRPAAMARVQGAQPIER